LNQEVTFEISRLSVVCAKTKVAQYQDKSVSYVPTTGLCVQRWQMTVSGSYTTSPDIILTRVTPYGTKIVRIISDNDVIYPLSDI
jgi:hypothetical protein